VIERLESIRTAEVALQTKIFAGLKQLDSIAELMKSDRVVYVDD
jgi:hypothetical protein